MKTTPKNTKGAKSIYEAWAPMIERVTGVKDQARLEWMTQLAHNTAKELNEAGPVLGTALQGNSAFGGVYSPYATLYNTPGVGDVMPAGQPALTGADYAANTNIGSGDKYPALLPLAMKVAAKTIGLDLVNTMPLQGPSGVLPYMDYVYAGAKQPYGAMPGYDNDHQNPNVAGWNNRYGLPAAFKAELKEAAGFDVIGTGVDKTAHKILLRSAKEGEGLVRGVQFKNDDLTVEFMGWSRIDGDLMFKVVTGNKTLGELGAADIVLKTEGEKEKTLTLGAPRMISMLEDHVLGFTGAGPRDNSAWAGTYNDGMNLYEPMSRGTGEQTAPRQLSLQLFTRHIQVGTIQVGCSVTQEQVTDLQKQWGIDVVKMVENAGIQELTQTINRHITSRLFGLGWKNMVKLVQVEGPNANLNITFDPNADGTQMTPAFAVPQHDADAAATDTMYGTAYGDFARHQVNVALPFKPAVVVPNAHFENRDTLLKRIATNIMLASNWIHQRGRYGAGTFVVTNITVASALQSNAHFTFSPVDNTLNQAAGQLYTIGTLAGMTVYVDPHMDAQDCRVLVGRKGGKEEPGVFFCPYVIAESVKIISEGTMSPKLMIKSRYALVNAGFYPECNYVTFFVDMAGL